MRPAPILIALAVAAGCGGVLRPHPAVASARASIERETILTRAADGRFYVVGRVDGTAVRFVVDPDASDVALSPADARRVGIHTGALRYRRLFETPYGIGHGAAFTARILAVGPARIPRERMWVNRNPMPSSLLGLVFLKGLASYQLRGGELDLRWKD